MTPEERDRLVRLEERVANLAEDNKEIRAQNEAILGKLTKLSDAFTIATSFGKGAMWTIIKVAGLIVMGITALSWLLGKLSALKALI